MPPSEASMSSAAAPSLLDTSVDAMSGRAGEFPMGCGGSADASVEAAAPSTAPMRKKREKIAPAPPNTSSDRPCLHNDWDNVRVKKGFITLRCRICQLQWKTETENIRKCIDYFQTSCSRGTSCPYPHIHRYKMSVKTREERFGVETGPNGSCPSSDRSENSDKGVAKKKKVQEKKKGVQERRLKGGLVMGDFGGEGGVALGGGAIHPVSPVVGLGERGSQGSLHSLARSSLSGLSSQQPPSLYSSHSQHSLHSFTQGGQQEDHLAIPTFLEVQTPLSIQDDTLDSFPSLHSMSKSCFGNSGHPMTPLAGNTPLAHQGRPRRGSRSSVDGGLTIVADSGDVEDEDEEEQEYPGTPKMTERELDDMVERASSDGEVSSKRRYMPTSRREAQERSLRRSSSADHLSSSASQSLHTPLSVPIHSPYPAASAFGASQSGNNLGGGGGGGGAGSAPPTPSSSFMGRSPSSVSSQELVRMSSDLALPFAFGPQLSSLSGQGQ